MFANGEDVEGAADEEMVGVLGDEGAESLFEPGPAPFLRSCSCFHFGSALNFASSSCCLALKP